LFDKSVRLLFSDEQEIRKSNASVYAQICLIPRVVFSNLGRHLLKEKWSCSFLIINDNFKGQNPISDFLLLKIARKTATTIEASPLFWIMPVIIRCAGSNVMLKKAKK